MLCGVILCITAPTIRAQIVQNGSFENLNTATVPAPNWASGATTETAIAGTNGWFTRLSSPDMFWGANVPNNFMTTWALPRTPFHGANYAGISTGRFYGVFSTEILAGTLTSNPVGAPFIVHARFAMGSARNQPAMVRVSLDGPSGPFVVGHLLVNSTNWMSFSQIINLPASGSYDRIVFNGVDSTPNAYGAYVFIDSVDINPASTNPCDYLAAHIQYDATIAGTCCWKLFIDDNLPPNLPQLFRVRLKSIAPTTLSGAVSNGPGWTSVTNLPYNAAWGQTNAGPVANGNGIYVGTYCLNPGQPPQMQVIDFVDGHGGLLCRDTIYTDCPGEWHPCIEHGVPQVTCGPVVNGNQTYNVGFGMSVLNGLPGYVSFTSPQGTVSPSTVIVPPYSQFYNLVFTDTPPVDTHACLYVTQHYVANGVDSIVCNDTICFDLPQCPHDCCENFIKSFSQVKVSYSNGNVNVGGCVMAGPSPIKRFSATIVAAQSRVKCIGPAGAWQRIFGDIINSSLGAALTGPQYVPTMVYSREAVWGGPASPNCVSFNPCVPFSLKMIFPNPPISQLCRDTLRFAIRYSFTDCNCITCDTIVTYQIVRKYTPIIWGGTLPHTDPPADIQGSDYVTPDPALLNITMSSETRGTLSVTLPSVQDGDPHIRIVGMQLRPEGVAVSDLTQQGTSNRATIAGNLADISYTLDQGNTALFSLDYLNGNGDQKIRNLMVFRYVMLDDSTNTDTTTSDTTVVYATTQNGGGDVVERTDASVKDVRTYALHLMASNGLNEAVSALKLHVNGDATLIAVGPVGDGTNAVLTPGADNAGNGVVQVDKNTWTVENVDAGSTLDPIYLTFAGVGNNTVSVDYSTMSADGSAISSGSADINSPLRVAGIERESAEMGAALMPIYPNPTAHSATVQFDLAGTARVSVAVHDVRGIEVLHLIDGQQLGAGEHLVPIDIRTLPVGTYVVVMDVDGRTLTQPFTIVR